MNTLDTTLNNLRPKYSSSFQDQPAHWSNSVPTIVPQTPHGSEKWNPRMWQLIDKEMTLKQCSIYCYAPEEDPYDGEEGSIWSFNYFFFNKAKKRVCYLYLRGLSIIGSSEPPKTPIKTKRPASGTWSIDEDTSKKRARYWLGDRAGDAECVAADDEGVSGEWDEENLEEAEVLDKGDEPRYVLFDSDTGSESPCKGRGVQGNSDTGSPDTGSDRLGGENSRDGSSVRGVSEGIAASMDL